MVEGAYIGDVLDVLPAHLVQVVDVLRVEVLSQELDSRLASARLAHLRLIEVVNKAIHALVALGQIVRAVRPREMVADALLEVVAGGQPIRVYGDGEELAEVARARLKLIGDERRLAATGLAHDHYGLLESNHNVVDHCADAHGARRVHEHVEWQTLMHRTAECGQILRPQLELVHLDVIVVIVYL